MWGGWILLSGDWRNPSFLYYSPHPPLYIYIYIFRGANEPSNAQTFKNPDEERERKREISFSERADNFQ